MSCFKQYTKNLLYTIKILVKDGRYKYEITDLLYKGSSGGAGYSVEQTIIDNLYKSNGEIRLVRTAKRKLPIIFAA